MQKFYCTLWGDKLDEIKMLLNVVQCNLLLVYDVLLELVVLLEH